MPKYQNLITALLIVAICALGFVTYQQQNYIESLSQSVHESDAPTKKIVRRIQNVEGEVDSNKVALDELDRRVSDLEGTLMILAIPPHPSTTIAPLIIMT